MKLKFNNKKGIKKKQIIKIVKEAIRLLVKGAIFIYLHSEL